MVLFERAPLWEKDESQWINYNGSESHQFSLKRLSHLIISFCKTTAACNLNSTFICKQLMIYPCDILHQNWPKCSWEEKLILECGALALDLEIPPAAGGDGDCNRGSSKMTISMQKKGKKCKKKVWNPLNLKSHIGCAPCLSEARSKHFYLKDAQSQKSLQYI